MSLVKKIIKARKIKMNGNYILSMVAVQGTLQSFMTAHDTASMSERGFIYEAVCILIGAFGLLGNTKISLDNFNSYPNIKAAKSIIAAGAENTIASPVAHAAASNKSPALP